MDNVLKLFSELIVDLHGFNDSHFGIFHEDEQKDLKYIWFHEAKRDLNKFISMLSPAQKKLIAIWAIQRTSYSTVRLIETLEKFTHFLKTLDSPIYPIVPFPSTTPGIKKGKVLKGWKKIIYKSKEVSV